VRVATSLPVRLLISAGLLAAIALTIDWGEVGERLGGGEWGWFAGAVGAALAALAVGAYRWHWLLGAAGLPVSARQTARAYWVGLFANNFLPTGFGGDAARALLVARGGAAIARSLTSVVFERATGILCLLAVGLVAMAVSPAAVPGELRLALGAASAAAVGATALTALGLRRRRLRRLLPARLVPWAREVRDTVVAYGRDRRLLALILALGVVFQLLIVGSTWMLSRSIGLDLDFALVAVVQPLVLLVLLFPVSIAGFGVREGGFVVLLGTAGVSAADATLLSLLSVVVLALATSPGALGLLTRGTRQSIDPGGEAAAPPAP
jgi:uncharacterized membrane protein YbhN (UPF0104 family)